MTTTCVFPGCDKPVRPTPRARYCSWEHLTDAANLRERENRRKKRHAVREAARRAPAPAMAPAAAEDATLPPAAFADDPRAETDLGSRYMPHRVVFALGASSLVGR